MAPRFPVLRSCTVERDREVSLYSRQHQRTSTWASHLTDYLERLIPLTPGLRNMVTCGAPWHKNKYNQTHYLRNVDPTGICGISLYLEIAEAKLVDGEQLREGSLTCYRIERMEPDFKNGRFYLPALVYHPTFRDKNGHGGHNGWVWWSVSPDKELGTGKPTLAPTDNARPASTPEPKPLRNVRCTERVLGAPRADGFRSAFETNRRAGLHSTESKCQKGA